MVFCKFHFYTALFAIWKAPESVEGHAIQNNVSFSGFGWQMQVKELIPHTHYRNSSCSWTKVSKNRIQPWKQVLRWLVHTKYQIMKWHFLMLLLKFWLTSSKNDFEKILEGSELEIKQKILNVSFSEILSKRYSLFRKTQIWMIKIQLNSQINDKTDSDSGFILVWTLRYKYDPFKIEE